MYLGKYDNVEIQWDFEKNIKNIDLKPFVMDLSHANFTKWVGHGQFHIKIEGQLLMTGV